MHEYHIAKNIHEIQKYPLDQGTKLFTDSDNQVKYFILPNMLIMPYSYLSVLQHFQGEAQDQNTKKFYTEDIYRIHGETQLSKLIEKPLLLEKLLDNYWLQERLCIASLLTYNDGNELDPLQALLDMNCDSLINKILHYLSYLPLQCSFRLI